MTNTLAYYNLVLNNGCEILWYLPMAEHSKTKSCHKNWKHINHLKYQNSNNKKTNRHIDRERERERERERLEDRQTERETETCRQRDRKEK